MKKGAPTGALIGIFADLQPEAEPILSSLRSCHADALGGAESV